jgi:WD40 repeat protein
LVYTPDGKTIWGLCDDNRLRLWDVASARSLKAVTALGDAELAELPRLSANSLAISPDGGLIAVGGGGTTNKTQLLSGDEARVFEIRVHSANTGELVWSHLGRRGYMQQLAFSPNGNTLASADFSEVKLWDGRSGDLRQSMKPSSGTVWSLAFSPDGTLLAGYGEARVEERIIRRLTLWDLRTGAIVHSIEAGQAHGATAPGTLAFSPDDKLVASADIGIKEGPVVIEGRQFRTGQKVINHIKLWDVAKGTLVWTSAEGDLGGVTSLVFSPDGNSLFCCDSSATTRIDARTGQTRQDLMTVTAAQPR